VLFLKKTKQLLTVQEIYIFISRFPERFHQKNLGPGRFGVFSIIKHKLLYLYKGSIV